MPYNAWLNVFNHITASYEPFSIAFVLGAKHGNVPNLRSVGGTKEDKTGRPLYPYIPHAVENRKIGKTSE